MIKKQTCIISAVFTVSIILVNVLSLATGFGELWPGFFVVLLYLIGKCQNYSELKEIIGGGLIGILWSWWVITLIGYLSPEYGFIPSYLAVIAVSVFIIVVLGDISTTLFNNYSAMYFFTATLLPQKPIEWAVSIIVVGCIFSFFVFGGIKFFLAPPKNMETASDNIDTIPEK